MTSIKLHPFSKNDFRELISWIRSPQELFIWSATTFTFPLDEDQLERHYQDAEISNTRLLYTALDSQTGERIGHIELIRIDREKRKASIAYVLVDPSKRGYGYGSAMLQNILEQCFQRMKMLKVDLFVFESNLVAIRCYQKAGFEVEEAIKDRIKYEENFAPLYLMGLSLEKWMASNSQPFIPQ